VLLLVMQVFWKGHHCYCHSLRKDLFLISVILVSMRFGVVVWRNVSSCLMWRLLLVVCCFLMEWRGILCSLLFIVSVGESSSRFGIMWHPNLGVDSGQYLTWPILSASVFVVIAILLPMYLIFEHLASYNQPEVCYYFFNTHFVVFSYS